MADSKDLEKDSPLDEAIAEESEVNTEVSETIEETIENEVSANDDEKVEPTRSGNSAADKPRKSENRHKMKKSGNPAKGTKRSIEAARAERERPSKPVKVKSLQSPRWWAPLLVTLMLIGLLIVVAAYVMGGNFPIKGFGNGNLFIGFGFMLTGFLMTLGWK